MIRFFLLFLLSFYSLQAKEPVVVFASGNNKFVLPEIINSFNSKHPDTKLLVQYGATGDLAEAILQGVEYDIFLAADMRRAQKVFLANKAVAPAKQYAQGSLILFVPADNTLNQRKLIVLTDSSIKNITIANSKTAPYGQASIEVLNNLNLYNQLSEKIRYSTDISTVITNVVWYDDAGFLSKSAINSLPMGYRKEGLNWIEIDASLYKPIIQGYVMSKRGSQSKCANTFMEFILSKEGQAIYHSYGYK